MKAVLDAKRIEAVTLFMDKPNTDLLSKEELITGIETIIGIRPISTEARELYTIALEAIYKGRR